MDGASFLVEESGAQRDGVTARSHSWQMTEPLSNPGPGQCLTVPGPRKRVVSMGPRALQHPVRAGGSLTPLYHSLIRDPLNSEWGAAYGNTLPSVIFSENGSLQRASICPRVVIPGEGHLGVQMTLQLEP